MENKAYRNFSYVTIGTIIPASILAIFFLAFAKILEPTEFGEMGYLIAFAITFSAVSRFGLPFTVQVYRAKNETKLSNQINSLTVITTSIASILLLFINEFSAILCLCFSFCFLSLHNLLGEKKYKNYMYMTLLRAGLTFVLPFPLYFVLGIPGIILGMALGNILSCLWFFTPSNFTVKSFRMIKTNYKVFVNNFAIDASINLVRSIDRLLVGTVFGFLFAGLYIFNMQVLFGLEIIPRVLYLFLLSEESGGKEHKKMSYFVVIISIIIAILGIFFSPIIIEQLFPNYYDGVQSLQILIITIIPISISLIISAKMQAKESTKVGYSAIVSISSLLILLGLLGNEYGLIGLSLAIVVSSILNTIFLYFLFHYSKPKNSPVNRRE